jgi:hypothetical protein
MKKAKLLMLIVLISSCITVSAHDKTVLVSASEQDAIIYADGKQVGTGSAEVVVPAYGQVFVQAKKAGFITAEVTFYNYSGKEAPPKTYQFTLEKDDAFEGSIKNDYANTDFEQEINSKFSDIQAWKLISEIVTSYFDNIEMADKETGYLKTNWQSKSFKKCTVRTRVIVKQSSSSPLKYKIKIISEISDSPNSSVKDDDKFKEWDRILKKYDGLITEFQTRLGGK